MRSGVFWTKFENAQKARTFCSSYFDILLIKHFPPFLIPPARLLCVRGVCQKAHRLLRFAAVKLVLSETRWI